MLTVLSGMTYLEHLQDNLRSYCPLTPLTQEETQFLYDTADLMMQYPTIPCNDCPGVLLHYNRCVNEGNIPRDRLDPDYRRARRAFLVGYDRSVPRLRQSSYCIGCNECVSHCPQNIRIPQEMARIDRFVEHLKQDTL